MVCTGGSLSSIVLAIAAFAVSWSRRSYLAAGLLAASGIIFTLAAMIATVCFAVIAVPGPILGVIIGMGIFGLCIVKDIRTARAPLAATLSR